MTSTSPDVDETVEKNAATCPVVEAVEQVGSQWRPVVRDRLEGDENRFDELKRSTGASSRPSPGCWTTSRRRGS